MSVRNQAVTAAMVVGNSVDWDNVDLQVVIDAVNKRKLGPALTQWLANKGWLPPRPPLLTIDRLKLVHDIGPKWQVWLGPVDGNGLEGEPDVDQRAGLVTTFDVSKVRFLSGLVEGKSSITGEEKLRILRAGTYTQIDAQTLWALYTEKGQVTLRWLHEVHGVTWMEALGTVLRGPNGYRYSLVLCRKADGSWVWNHCRWLVDDRNASNPALGLASTEN